MFGGITANALYTMHMGQTGNGPSQRLWSKALNDNLSPVGNDRPVMFYDEFRHFTPVTVTTAAAQLQPGNGYHAYIEADATVGSILPLSGGGIRLLGSTDAADGDNHDTVLTSGGNVAGLAAIGDSVANNKLTIFEARIKLPSVTDGAGSYFVGLGEPGLAAANTPLVDDTGHTLSDDDLIGFAVLEDNNDALKFVYRKNGGALQTVFTYATALVAATWVKVGFVFDPSEPPSRRLRAFVDNVEQSTMVSQTAISAATFPNDESLALVAAVKNSANAAAQTFDLDWWGFYQA